MTVADANRFTDLVARRHGYGWTPQKNPWQAIRRFFHEHVPVADTKRYLTELTRRKQAGEPLIQAIKDQ